VFRREFGPKSWAEMGLRVRAFLILPQTSSDEKGDGPQGQV